jgi:hypothetical protein
LAGAAHSQGQSLTSATLFAVAPTEDDSLFRAIIANIKEKKIYSLPIGERVVAIGSMFLGKPYVDKTLDVNPENEQLVCNFRGLDCVTFFENSWAFAKLIKKFEQPSLVDFQNELRNQRYRDGKLNGFSSRLHYTSDYFFNNAFRGFLKDMTKEIGGKYAAKDTRPINFMSNHVASYPQLAASETEVKKTIEVEKNINSRGGYYFIKKEDIAKIESGIMPGDLIGITTSFKGLDCSHTGIAIKGKDGRIHFMHASLTKHKVIISDEPFAEYLAGNSKQTGIIIFRPQEVCNK